MTLLDAFRARRRIESYVRHTPLVASRWLSELTRAAISLKLESLQVTNSFKARGAFNALLARLQNGTRPGRLATASAGNHGRALAAAAETFGLPLTVFTPADAPRTKIEAIRRHGADLRADNHDYDDAERLAKAFARETGALFISAYNDADVIAGAATTALEILEDAPDTEVFVVPVGGGGLISGIGAVVKAVSPSIEVIGVEVEASCAFRTSLSAGRLVTIVPGPTLADGLGGNPDPDTITFPMIQRWVDRIVTVSERDLASAIVGLVQRDQVVVEGAAAAPAAALIAGRADVGGRRVALIVTGANIDGQRLASLLEQRETTVG